MVGETSGRYPIRYREGCKTVRLPPLRYLDSESLSLLPAGGLEGGTLKLENVASVLALTVQLLFLFLLAVT